MYNGARHIDTRVYRIREVVTGATPEVCLYKIIGEYQESDIFTKGLPRPAFEKHRAVLMSETPSEQTRAHAYTMHMNIIQITTYTNTT